jgi:hypothetical protein
VTSPTASVFDFSAAARRHYDDAEHLLSNNRLPSADHLAGLAAECALKAILLRFLGASLGPSGKPISTINSKNVPHGHLPTLWANLPLVATGRSGAQFAALINRANPFGAWDVADRYRNGATITHSRVQGHISEAKKILVAYQTAEIAGALP